VTVHKFLKNRLWKWGKIEQK